MFVFCISNRTTINHYMGFIVYRIYYPETKTMQIVPKFFLIEFMQIYKVVNMFTGYTGYTRMSLRGILLPTKIFIHWLLQVMVNVYIGKTNVTVTTKAAPTIILDQIFLFFESVRVGKWVHFDILNVCPPPCVPI